MRFAEGIRNIFPLHCFWCSVFLALFKIYQAVDNTNYLILMFSASGIGNTLYIVGNSVLPSHIQIVNFNAFQITVSIQI